MNLLGSRNQKLSRVKVTTMDADLNSIVIEFNWTGRQLFDTVCRIIGLREIWYFGLRYMNKKDLPSWLQMDKKICNQDVPKQADGSMHFLFLVKFYPETVEEELIQDITRHLFFLQIKQSILSMDLYCQPEAAVLLASYAVQALYGDCPGTTTAYYDHGYEDSGGMNGVAENEVTDGTEVELDLSRLLPQSVINQYDMSADMWEERIRKWWANNSGLSTEDAEMEYLRVAQDLDMYGIQYYPIFNQKDTDLLLGVSAQGIGIYEISNRLSPRPFFPWTEIKNISFQNKLFVICVTDNSKIKFRAQDCTINASILDLCIGTHNLYLRRRQPDLLEIQQMKVQARELRQKRIVEQNRLLRERELRQQAEAERDRFQTELAILKEQLAAVQSVMKSTEESHKLIAEKARLSEKETLELSKRASEAEAEVQRAKLSQMQAEETKMLLERKLRDAESMTQRLMRDAKQQQQKFHSKYYSKKDELENTKNNSSYNNLNNNNSSFVNNNNGTVLYGNNGNRFSMNGDAAMRSNGFGGDAITVSMNDESLPDNQRRGSHYHSQQALCENENGAANVQLAHLPNAKANESNEKSANILRYHSYGELHHIPPSSSRANVVDSAQNNVSTNFKNQTLMLNGATSCGMLTASDAADYNFSAHLSAGNNSEIAGRKFLANGRGSTAASADAATDDALSGEQTAAIVKGAEASAALNGSGFRRELKHLYAEIEKSRKEYYQKNRNLKERLMDFRTEIEMLKRESRQTEHDRIYTSNLQSGIDKYSTLRKSGAGSSKSRVKVFDGL